jgi:glucose-6-phosphate dehydrogenase assembly protein OpcA
MASAVIERAWRDTEPDAIELRLAELWRDVGRTAPVARAVMSNLVVFRACGGADEFRSGSFHEAMPIDEVVARHPSRVIVIAHDDRSRDPRSPERARVGVLTYGPPQARFGVEQIVIQSACAEASLASIVRRLIRGDLPTSVWWSEDMSKTAPFESLVTLGRQLIYDSRGWRDIRRGVLALQPAVDDARIHCADVNWRRLAPVRRALLHAGDALSLDDLSHANVRFIHRPGDGALAWLMAGWLSARLSWPDERAPRIEEARRADEVLTLAIGQPTHTTVTLTTSRAIVKQRGWPPYTMPVPRESEADMVAAQLQTLSVDVCLRDALAALIRRFTSATSL